MIGLKYIVMSSIPNHLYSQLKLRRVAAIILDITEVITENFE